MASSLNIRNRAWIDKAIIATLTGSMALLLVGLLSWQIPIGSQIKVRGYQAKDKRCQPACKANGRDLTFADGRKVFMGSSGTGAPRDGTDPREG